MYGPTFSGCLCLRVCVWQVHPDEILSAVSPQNPSELYEHKAVMNLSPPVILSWAAGGLHSQSRAATASCALSGFFFFPKTKRVVLMLSENYSVQDV